MSDARKLYLDLLERSPGNAIYGESQLEMKVRGFLQRIRHPYLTYKSVFAWPSKAHSMIGAKRLRNLRTLVENVIADGVPGDLIETGVWRGGACILMRGVLKSYAIADRRVFVADSFEGLPKPDANRYPADKRDRLFKFSELAISEETVRGNFAAYDLLDDQVVFLKGFFSETLPKLGDERFALIRLDGDMYGSTMDALTNLYDRLNVGGYVIIDDYGGLANCRRAVHDFLNARGLTPQIHTVDESGVWWQKTA